MRSSVTAGVLKQLTVEFIVHPTAATDTFSYKIMCLAESITPVFLWTTQHLIYGLTLCLNFVIDLHL